MTDPDPRAAITFHLAQFNVARAKGPTDGPVMTEFMANLDRINAVADASPGFVWRLQTEDGTATSIRAFDDPDMLLNLSVWEDFESLHHYVYKTDHVDYVRRRSEWFEPVEGLPVTVMWWVPAGSVPTVEESIERLHHLADKGPTAQAFSFRRRFAPPVNIDGS
ncbi:MAG: DUF3291 domain-containing protein [Acidimicrobiia bacterium]|nr:DUF3291 domain-containing protein [Acidimicrobiia bacterium]